MVGGQEFFLVAEMPFANDPSGVALLLENFRYRNLIRIETAAVAGKQDPAPRFVLMQADSFGVASRHERGPGWGTDSTGRIEIGEDPAFRCHLIEVRRSVFCGIARRSDIGIAEVVAIDDDEIWLFGGPRECEKSNERQLGEWTTEYAEWNDSA